MTGTGHIWNLSSLCICHYHQPSPPNLSTKLLDAPRVPRAFHSRTDTSSPVLGCVRLCQVVLVVYQVVATCVAATKSCGLTQKMLSQHTMTQKHVAQHTSFVAEC